MVLIFKIDYFQLLFIYKSDLRILAKNEGEKIVVINQENDAIINISVQ